MAATWVDAEAASNMRPCQGIGPSKLKIENQQGNKHTYTYIIFIQNFREKEIKKSEKKNNCKAGRVNCCLKLKGEVEGCIVGEL